MKLSITRLIVALVISFAFIVNGTVVFQDDFSNGANSNQSWIAQDAFVKKEFKNGTCVVTDDSTAPAFLYHELTTEHSVFTVSSKITLTKSNTLGGFATCFNQTNYKGIYILLGSDKYVYIGEYGQNLSGFPCPYITSGGNLLTVSRSGTAFNVFVDGNFITSYQSTQIPGKNISLLVMEKGSATYDDFLMTDQFTNGSVRKEFSDNFNSGLKVEWTPYAKKGTAAVNTDGKLELKTENNDSAYINMVVDAKPTEFVGKAEFVHRSGTGDKTYGFVLYGDGVTHQAIFGITAKRFYGATVDTQKYSLTSKSSIRGQAYTDPESGAVTYYTDTLELVKKAGSNEYIFIANKDTLTRFNKIDFEITRIGVFCQSNMDITIDNFAFISSDVAVKIPYRINKSSLKTSAAINRGTFVFDPLGRAVFSNRILNKKVSTGLYFIKNQNAGNSVILVKNKR